MIISSTRRDILKIGIISRVKGLGTYFSLKKKRTGVKFSEIFSVI